MKTIRTLAVGSLIWALVFTSFAVLDGLPSLKGNVDSQALIISFLMIPFATLGTYIYYKNGNKDHGFKIALIMALTALALDALVTVPLLEIPQGRSYQSFFSYPQLWLLVLLNMLTIYLYWRLKVQTKTP